jgi:hypothetical protein
MPDKLRYRTLGVRGVAHPDAHRQEESRMSSIPNGGSNLFLSSGGVASFTLTNGGTGWQGNALLEPQPFNTGSGMAITLGNCNLASSGQFQFGFTVRNNGPNSTFYNIQLSYN